MIGIIIVSILTIAVLFAVIGSLIGVIENFRTDRVKMQKNLIRFGVFICVFVFFGGLNAVLIFKYVYDSREKIADAADNLIINAIDKNAEYSARSALSTDSAYTKIYNANILRQFENLDISYSASKFEIRDGKKIYEIELVLDNTMPVEEELYFGNLVVKNYLIACDENDFVYNIVPEDAGAGFTNYEQLILNRNYSEFGKILPGKTMRKILVEVPENINITSLRFLDKKIEIR
jgi:hypothetical protein